MGLNDRWGGAGQCHRPGAIASGCLSDRGGDAGQRDDGSEHGHAAMKTHGTTS